MRCAALVEQFAGRDAKEVAELLDKRDCGIAGAALQVADVGSVDIHLEGKLLLRQPALQPQPLQICPKSLPNIHNGEMSAL